MSKILFIAAFLFMPCAMLFAQIQPKPKPVLVRRVNGVVRDSLGKTIPSATVRLVSSKDTLRTVTSEYGVFNFPAVHSEQFMIDVQMMSYHPHHKKYFLNDTKAILVLPPVVLRSSLVQLKELVVTTAKGPQQKGDTTEFWAKDYIVRDYARLEDMLKRMEGFSTDANGGLSYNGKPVSRALFNGAKYFDGDVAAAIKELPADIVERIQIIEENEDGTGPKSSLAAPTSQTLNIVTKADKSAGQMYQVALEGGTQDRYKETVSAKAIDGLKMWGLAASNMQEPLGIVSSREMPLGTISNTTERLLNSSGGGGSGGRLNGSVVNMSYNNRIGALGLNLLYMLNKTHNLNEQEQTSEEFYKEGSLKRNTKSRTDNSNTKHILSLVADLLKNNFRMQTSVVTNMANNVNDNFREVHQTGILDNLQRVVIANHSQLPSLQVNSILNFFESRKISLSVKVNSLINSMNGSGNNNTDIYGIDVTKPDSSLHLLQQQKTLMSTNSVSASLRYRWKAYTFSLEIVPLFNKNVDANYQDQLIPGQPARRLNELSNDNVLINYRLPVNLGIEYDYEKFSANIMATYETIWRNGRFNMKELALSNRSGTFLPSIMLRYTFGAEGSVYVYYNRSVNLPSLLQLSTRPYYTTPFDVVTGNPNLKNGVIDNYSMAYTYSIPSTGIMLNASASFNKTFNDIGANRLVQIDSARSTIRTETYYVNVKGGDNKLITWGMSKNFKAMNTTLKFSGRIQWGNQVFLADGNKEFTDRRMSSYDFTALFTPAKWLDLASSLAYNANNNNNSLQPGRPLYDNQFNAQLNAAIFLPADLKMNISAGQNISRASSLPVSQHPLILNANIEKRFLKKKNAIISFMVMDAFQQNNNNIISQTATGYSNTVSNLKSRYFLCQLSWNPQRFTRSKSATGLRKGNGSFIQ